MNQFKYSILLFLIFFTRRVISKADPGHVMCLYYGLGNEMCNVSTIKPSKMPSECTSFLIRLLIIDRVNQTKDTPQKDMLIENIISDSIGEAWGTGKPVYLITIHSVDDNIKYDGPDMEEKAKRDAKAILFLKADYNNLDGIVIGDFFTSDYKEKQTKQLVDGFHKYLKTLKNNLGGLTVGLGIAGDIFMDTFLKGDAGYDFQKFEKEVDFVTVAYSIFNPCTPDLRKGGIAPIDGDKPYTLRKLKQALDNAKIHKNKLYFQYQIFAVSERSSYLTDHNVCYSSSGRMCRHEEVTKIWCADTSETLRLKGKFAKENAVGMVIDTVDINDTEEDCKCGTQFPSLGFLLDGWNGKNEHPDCPLFDRPDVK